MVPGGMGVPSLVTIRVTSCFAGAAGVVVEGLESFDAPLAAAQVQVRWGSAGGGGGQCGSPGRRLGAAGLVVAGGSVGR